MIRLASIKFTCSKIISEHILSIKLGNLEAYRNDEAARRADTAITEGLNCLTEMSALTMSQLKHNSLKTMKITFKNRI